ncbi:hypothetical protein ACF8C6_00590 [Pseudomonas sp. zbq_18]|uniref:hypothetical protein n=1 Tax=Pseudomonas sp. zbq_18 TaxID=3367251 RepID=UPI00370AB17E
MSASPETSVQAESFDLHIAAVKARNQTAHEAIRISQSRIVTGLQVILELTKITRITALY